MARPKKQEKVKESVAYHDLGSTSLHIYSLDCPPIDIPLGAGGLKSGKIIELRGKESVGKSTTALELAFAFIDYWVALGVPKEKIKIRFIETESAFDYERTFYMRPDTADCFDVDECETIEEAHESIKKFLKSCLETGCKPFVIWDTLAAAETKAQNETGEMYAGGQMQAPRLLRYMFRDITALLGQSSGTLILPNQLWFGPPENKWSNKPKEESYGGGAVKYHPSVRVHLKKISADMLVQSDGSEIGKGIIVEGHTFKNKLTSPDQKFKFYINNESGIDKLQTCYMFLIDKKMIQVSGAWKKLIDVPVDTYENNKELKTMELSWQVGDCSYLQDLIEGTNITGKNQEFKKQPHIKHWIHYLIYHSYTTVSPLIKLKIIDKVHFYENLFFGKTKTVLTDREIKVAKAIELQEKKKQKKEDEKYQSKEKKHRI